MIEQLGLLPPGGSEGIPVVRSLQRRLLMLAPARARVERGERLDAVMASMGRALFWKDKSKIERMLRKWTADGLATVAERAGQLERSLMFSSAPERESLERRVAGNRAEGAQPLDWLAAEALADQVELVEARIMEGDGAALPLVADVHFQTENVAELALQGVEVGSAALAAFRALARPISCLGPSGCARAGRAPRFAGRTSPWR